MKIFIISQLYPGRHNQSDWVFVKQLVDAMALHGHECYVLSPYNVLHYRKYCPARYSYNVGDNVVHVFRPWYLSFSSFRVGNRSISSITFQKALRRAFRQIKLLPDVVYCHFWSAGMKAYYLASPYNIPLFVATGESSIDSVPLTGKDLQDFRDYVSGVVCVSSKNRDESIRLGLTTIEKCSVFPNAVNSKVFYKRDREECRRKLNLSSDKFIVAFVGWFGERKGSLRVSRAIENCQGEQVYSFFIGKPMDNGDYEPKCEGVLFKGLLSHDQVPIYLGAADCFVLPTQAEGCCNAVIEAMACGLPIISSNLPFNWDVLDDTNSVMVNPNNVEEITDAICYLRDNPEKRKALSEGALARAESLTIDKRAASILQFIEEKKTPII